MMQEGCSWQILLPSYFSWYVYTVIFSADSITIVLPVYLHSYKSLHAFKSPLKPHVLSQSYKLQLSVALVLIFSLPTLQTKKTREAFFCHIPLNKAT